SLPIADRRWTIKSLFMPLAQIRNRQLEIGNVSARVLRDIEQDSDGGECRHERRSAVRDERQRNSLGRHQRKHDTNIKERLRDDARDDSQTQQHSEPVRRQQSSANSAPEKQCEYRDDCERADQSQLLANYSKNKIGVSKRQKQHFLFALCETKPVDSARTNSDQRLYDLKTRALWIGPGIEKHDQTFQSERNEDQ